MRYFCTYFDHRYLSRGLALYRSLQQHCSSFRLWILCLSDECFEFVTRLQLPSVQPIALSELENGDPQLQDAKMNRTPIEYYFTCTPSLPLYIFKHHAEIDLLTYLDSDLYFFRDFTPLYEEIADHSVALIAHRFPPFLSHLEKYGLHNVGFLSFRRDENGLECLKWWREKCIEWCYDYCEDGRFADQKYLDEWTSRFQRVIVLSHKGANVAPWNLANYRIQKKADGVWIDDSPLLFFHFQGLKKMKSWLYDLNLSAYQTSSSRVIRQHIYGPYICALEEINHQMSGLSEMPLPRGKISPSYVPEAVPRLQRLFDTWNWRFHECLGIASGKYALVVNGRVL